MLNLKLKIGNKWWLLFIVMTLLFWWFLPQHTLKLRIDATPNSVQPFYVKTVVHFPSWHGVGNYKTIDRRLLLPNQTHSISIDDNLRPWQSGKMFVTVMHPEYKKTFLKEKGYRGKLLTLKPQSWSQILQNEPLLELQVPPLEDRPHDVYQDKLITGKILPITRLSGHMAWVRKTYLPKLNGKALMQMGTSIPVLRQLASFAETHSAGRSDGNKYTREALKELQNDLLLFENKLKWINKK